jgi:hypothetical protein
MTKQEIGVRFQRVPGASRIWTRAHSTTSSAISIEVLQVCSRGEGGPKRLEI